MPHSSAPFAIRAYSCGFLYIEVLAAPAYSAGHDNPSQVREYLCLLNVLYLHLPASSGPGLSVLQYPEDASVLLNSTVWLLCVFEYPSEEKEEPVVYWRRGPNCHNQQSLQSSSSVGRSQVHITKNTLRGFSILKLSNVDENASNSYFCDVTLTHKIQGKCGNGTRLTVHGKEHQE